MNQLHFPINYKGTNIEIPVQILKVIACHHKVRLRNIRLIQAKSYCCPMPQQWEEIRIHQ